MLSQLLSSGPEDNNPHMMEIISNLDICNENSEQFRDYLHKKGASQAAKNAGLTMRKANKIVPFVGFNPIVNCYHCIDLYCQRIGTPLGTPLHVMPGTLRDEDKYILVSPFPKSCKQ